MNKPEIGDLLALINSLQNGIVIVKNKKLVFANKKTEEILEENIEDFKNKTVFDFLPPQECSDVEERYDNVVRTGIGERNIHEIVLSNKKKKNVEVFSTLMDKESEVMLLEVRDVTKTVKEKNKIKSYTGRLEKAVNDAPVAIIIYDENGDIVYVNNVFGLLQLSKREDIIGRNIRDFENMKKRDKIFAKILYSFENKADINEVIYLNEGKFADYWLRISVKHLYSANIYDGFIAMIYDISESKSLQQKVEKLNKELNETIKKKDEELKIKTHKFERNYQALRFLLEDVHAIQEELKQANKELEAMNKDLESFNYSVSHDLKSPLRVIMNYSHFLKEDLADVMSDEQKHMLSELEKQAKKMSDLINDLLNFSRFGRAELNLVDIDMHKLFIAIVSEVLRDTENASKYKVTIDNIPALKADYAMMKQVVFNLVSNAVKFSALRKKPLINIGFERSNGKINIFVKDNGVGFDNEKSHIIFEPFTRLHNHSNVEGTGVGLSIVKRIIEKHGGEVYAEGRSDQGAKIGFILN